MSDANQEEKIAKAIRSELERAAKNGGLNSKTKVTLSVPELAKLGGIIASMVLGMLFLIEQFAPYRQERRMLLEAIRANQVVMIGLAEKIGYEIPYLPRLPGWQERDSKQRKTK